MADGWYPLDLNTPGQVSPTAKPEFIEGKWLDLDDKEITSARMGDSVYLYVKTRNVKDNTPFSITIFEYDFGPFNDDEFPVIPVLIKNNEIKIKIQLVKSAIYPQTLNIYQYVVLNLLEAETEDQYKLYFTVTGEKSGISATFRDSEDTYLKVGYHKFAIAGNDADSSSDRKSLMELAKFQKNFNYIVHGNSIKTGKEFIQTLRNFQNTPIDSLFISAHGSPYAIDFQTSGCNLYISKTNVTQIVRNVQGLQTWTPGADARYITDIKSLVNDGVLNATCEIIISACLCGSTPTRVTAIENARTGGPNQYNLSWAQLNANTQVYDNFANQLSKSLPRATIVATREQMDSGAGIGRGTLVIYINGILLDSSHHLYTHYDNLIEKYRTRSTR